MNTIYEKAGKKMIRKQLDAEEDEIEISEGMLKKIIAQNKEIRECRKSTRKEMETTQIKK